MSSKPKKEAPKIGEQAAALAKCIRAGSGTTVRVDEFSTAELVELATAAKAGGVMICIRGLLGSENSEEIQAALGEAGAMGNIAF